MNYDFCYAGSVYKILEVSIIYRSTDDGQQTTDDRRIIYFQNCHITGSQVRRFFIGPGNCSGKKLWWRWHRSGIEYPLSTHRFEAADEFYIDYYVKVLGARLALNSVRCRNVTYLTKF